LRSYSISLFFVFEYLRTCLYIGTTILIAECAYGNRSILRQSLKLRASFVPCNLTIKRLINDQFDDGDKLSNIKTSFNRLIAAESRLYIKFIILLTSFKVL